MVRERPGDGEQNIFLEELQGEKAMKDPSLLASFSQYPPEGHWWDSEVCLPYLGC